MFQLFLMQYWVGGLRSQLAVIATEVGYSSESSQNRYYRGP